MERTLCINNKKPLTLRVQQKQKKYIYVMLEQLKMKLLINLSITNLDMTKDLLKLCEKILDKSHKNKI